MSTDSVLRSLFVASPIPNGFTWTLASRLSQILSDVESHFGPRDSSYSIVGIEFRSGVPQFWFPGGGKHVAIQLGLECLEIEALALFQLSHEAVHLLTPVVGLHATVLEEGLATSYALEYVRRNVSVPCTVNDAKYEAAEGLVRPLMAAHPAWVRTLRIDHPRLSPIAAELLQERLSISQSLADTLASRFSTWQGT